MSSFASELAKALNRPHGPVKALMWFTIAFGGSYVYMEHIKPLQDAAAWEQMKKDIKTSVRLQGAASLAPCIATGHAHTRVAPLQLPHAQGDGWLPHYEARNPNDIATEYERTYGVERQLTTDFTWEQLEVRSPARRSCLPVEDLPASPPPCRVRHPRTGTT